MPRVRTPPSQPPAFQCVFPTKEGNARDPSIQTVLSIDPFKQLEKTGPMDSVSSSPSTENDSKFHNRFDSGSTATTAPICESPETPPTIPTRRQPATTYSALSRNMITNEEQWEDQKGNLAVETSPAPQLERCDSYDLCVTPPASVSTPRWNRDPLNRLVVPVTTTQPSPPPPPPPLPPGPSPSSGKDSLESSPDTMSLFGNSKDANSLQQRPVLYSAIGSLEDTEGHSLSGWKSRVEQTKPKYEFRSSNTPQILSHKSSSSKGDSKKSLISANVEQYEPKRRASQETGKAIDSKGGDVGPSPTSVSAAHSDSITPSSDATKQSNLRKPGSDKARMNKKVTISDQNTRAPQKTKRVKPPKKQVEMFRPSSDAYTPRMGKKEIKFKPAELRTPVQKTASPMGTLSRPNFKDALRRVAMILHQHVVKIERRFENKNILRDDKLFREDMKEVFSESRYVTPTYRCTMVRVPMARPGMMYGLKRIRREPEIPSEAEIYEFAHRLFKSVQLSSECSIVCLIYVERLMETAKVPLLATTWRPIFMCGLLLASKVWQDLSSWNVEFASVYPQFSLEAINRLEHEFLRNVRWDLYISSSCYAKYYFALRSLVEKPDFRQRYNRMVGGVDSVQASEALKVEKRSSMVKEEAISQLSRSM